MQSTYWKRVSKGRRVGRRAVLGGAAALAAGFVAACGGDDKAETPSTGAGATAPASTAQAGAAAQAGTPKRGGVLKTFFTAETKTLDAHKTSDNTQTYINRLAYNGLLQQVEPSPGDFQIKVDLAESWEAVDAATYTFKLRKGVKFHNKAPVNGREFKADDVKANLERLGSDKAYRATAANFKLISSIETPDDYTVRVKLSQPFAAFPMNVASVMGPMMMPPEIWDDAAARTMIGTGPFVLESWDGPVGFKFSRNPEYFVQGKPYVDGVEHGVITDESRALSGFQAGSLDIMTRFQLSNVKSAKSVAKANVHAIPGTGGRTLFFNHLKKPYDDLRVRQAVMYATDPNEHIQVVMEGLSKRDGILSAGFKKYAWEESKLWKQDVKKAKDLLTAAGYPSGIEDELLAAPQSFIADIDTVSQRQLRQAGINVKLVPGDYNGWVDKIINCDKHLMEQFGYSAYETPDRYLYPYLHSVAGFKCWYHSTTLDANLDKGRATTKEEDAIKVYNDIQQECMDNVAYVPLFSSVITFAWQGHVKGVEPGIGEAYLYRHIENYWIDRG